MAGIGVRCLDVVVVVVVGVGKVADTWEMRGWAAPAFLVRVAVVVVGVVRVAGIGVIDRVWGGQRDDSKWWWFLRTIPYFGRVYSFRRIGCWCRMRDSEVCCHGYGEEEGVGVHDGIMSIWVVFFGL